MFQFPKQSTAQRVWLHVSGLKLMFHCFNLCGSPSAKTAEFQPETQKICLTALCLTDKKICFKTISQLVDKDPKVSRGNVFSHCHIRLFKIHISGAKLILSRRPKICSGQVLG